MPEALARPECTPKALADNRNLLPTVDGSCHLPYGMAEHGLQKDAFCLTLTDVMYTLGRWQTVVFATRLGVGHHTTTVDAAGQQLPFPTHKKK